MPPSLPPRTFQPDASGTARANYASGYPEESASDQADLGSANATSNAAASDSPAAEPRRWLPLTTSLLLLFVSMGGNAYLGVQWWSTRRRCQELLRRNRAPQPGTSKIGLVKPEDEDDDEDQEVRAVGDDESRYGS
jgi:hypothetical protein